MIRQKIKALIYLTLLLFWLLTAGTACAGVNHNRVVALTVEGPIVPVTASYIQRGIKLAENEGIACIIKLDTPGGLYSSTQQIVGYILNAGVPVIVYVSPQGGWAGSAGTFITIAAHYAVMAPGSRIGAAHPVSTTGQTEQSVSDVSSQKITEDAAAWVRSLAQLRGRNVQAAELAVRESKSYSDQEALKIKLIDARARTMDELLKDLNGKELTIRDGRIIILTTDNADLFPVAMNLREKILTAISNPEVAYLLFTLGMIGLIAEIYHPGAVFPGLVGVLGLLLGLYGLGTLDAYWVGIMLLVLAFGLFTAEAFVTSHGVIGAGGAVSFVMGSVLLFSGSGTGFAISPWLIAVTTAFFMALVGLLLLAVVKGQKRHIITGTEGIIGQTAVARSPLNPAGIVIFSGGLWNAVSEEGAVDEGEEVVISSVKGLKLTVKKKNNS
jgi:membrane-bound serine protease (ClpP class)